MKWSKKFEDLRGRKHRYIDDEHYRRYAVMVALVESEGLLHVLFERRSNTLKRQPGEICFPGGAREPGESPEENAIRETVEELKIGRDQIEVIAQMDTFRNYSDDEIAVFLCRLKDFEMSYSREESSEIFLVPLRYFMENPPDIYAYRIHVDQEPGFPFDKIPGGADYKWKMGRRNVYFYEYEDKVIWGMTAYIMQSVVGILKKEAGLLAD